jgi:tetratricopeptide (TPR) repeat protein
MDITRIIQQHKKICNLVSERRLKQSLDILADMVFYTTSGDIHDDFENLVMTYRNMLTYTIEGITDPERNRIYLRLIQSILVLSDKVKQDILSHNSGWHTYWVKQQAEKEIRLSGKTIIESVDDLLFKSELDRWLSNEAIPDPESEISKNHKQLINNIFNHLWLTDYYGEAEKSLNDIILRSGKFEWYESSLFTTAITLSALRSWQPEKLLCLIAIYENGQEQNMERALSGLILNLHYYNSRILSYPDIIRRISDLSNSNNMFREHSRIIVLQIIRSRETEKLGKKLHDEILPQVSKIKPRIEEKLDLENILPKDITDEKNPDWAEMFSDSEEIFKTMEELTKLQMEGADVYMSAFANMKHFDFFNDFKNWFMPFYPDHETINEIYKDEILGPGTNELAEALYKTPFICNSDKYSLILNLKYLPSAQKSMMLKVFRLELEGLQQMDDETGIDPYRNFRINVTQYLQDFYRFFKLSPYKKEFEDLFSGKIDIYNSEFFKLTCNLTEAEAGLADYFFSKEFYDDALFLFLKQINEKPAEVELYEKIAYCYQESSDYETALEFYKRAELINRKVWTLKKIGFCLRRLGRNDEALESYLHAGDLEPDNMHTILMTAHCFLDIKEYEKALGYYFRIEYNDPGNIKILRPIAYCYLALGRLDDSEKYYDRLSEGKLNAHDMINKGHLALCKGKKKDAIELYRQSITGFELTKEQFISIYSEDKNILMKNGINPDDLPIILDYLLFILG